MFIDVSKCYGCMACVVACAAENNVPIGVFKTWVERHVLPSGSIVFVPKQCNHCDNPPCVKPCPTGANYKNKDGLVLVDPEKCIGCGACDVSKCYGCMACVVACAAENNVPIGVFNTWVERHVLPSDSFVSCKTH
jgi:tetrathionate reductase subunit B